MENNTHSLPAASGAPESGLLENGRIYLNTASVVDRIIRDFTSETLAAVGSDGFMAKLDFQCRALNNLFLGISPNDRYQLGAWNNPDGMGEYVLHALGINGESRTAVRDAFMIYISKMIERADPAREFDPEIIEPLIADLRNALLGLSEASPVLAHLIVTLCFGRTHSAEAAVLLIFKSHIPGYTKKDGTYVAPHENKVVKKVEPAKPVPQKALFDTKAPLPDDAYANVGKPQEIPPAPAPKAISSKPKSTVAQQAMASIKETTGKPKWQNSLHAGSTDKKLFPGEEGASKKQYALFGGAPKAAKPHYPNAIVHPQLGEDGKPFQINEPSKPTDHSTWADPKAAAVFVPGGAVPAELHGVPFRPWSDHPQTDEGWEFVDGIMHDLEEPPLETKGKAPAAGVIVEEEDGRIWLVSPSNGFAGYKTTFPKGHADDGMSLQASAIKECFEESGLQVEITGLYGDVERGQTVARYYKARRVGGTPAAMGWETQAVRLVPKDQLHQAVNRSVDRKVAALAGIKAPAGMLESADDWEKVGKQAGSNPGGIYRDEAGQEWYVKVPKSSNIAKNEVLAAKLYEAAGVRVPELKHVMVDDQLAIASKMVGGLEKLPKDVNPSEIPGVMSGFAVDAWLANWDVVGLAYDNLLVDPDGRAVRVDVGGSLVFRAQGEPKGKHFGNEVGELTTLINGMNPRSTAIFGRITHDELHAGIQKVAAVPDEVIRKLCMKHGPGTKEQRAELGDKLVARKQFLISTNK